MIFAPTKILCPGSQVLKGDFTLKVKKEGAKKAQSGGGGGWFSGWWGGGQKEEKAEEKEIGLCLLNVLVLYILSFLTMKISREI